MDSRLCCHHGQTQFMTPMCWWRTRLIGSHLMTLSHHRVKFQKLRSSYKDAMKGNHHHPWLPRVQAGGHQGSSSSRALASHSRHLLNNNGDSSIYFSTHSSCFLLLHLLYELTACALSLPRLASRMARSTPYLLHVCIKSSLCGKSKYHLNYVAVEMGQYLTASPVTAGSWEEGQPPSPPLHLISLQSKKKKTDPLSGSLHDPVKTPIHSVGNDLSE